MITDDMIHCPIARPVRRRIGNDTPGAPSAGAEAVWEEANLYLKAELPRAWVWRLADRATMIYHCHAWFRELLCKNGDAGRDWLWAFTRHWLATLIAKHRPELHTRLPGGCSTGRELPHCP